MLLVNPASRLMLHWILLPVTPSPSGLWQVKHLLQKLTSFILLFISHFLILFLQVLQHRVLKKGVLPFVKRLFRVDLTAVPTQQERYAIVKSFPSSWEISEHWCDVDDLHKTIDYVEVFWFPSSSNPVFPPLPDCVTVTGIS